jgi:hypothetical protein
VVAGRREAVAVPFFPRRAAELLVEAVLPVAEELAPVPAEVFLGPVLRVAADFDRPVPLLWTVVPDLVALFLAVAFLGAGLGV